MGLLRRLSTPAFWLLALFAALVCAVVVFFIVGLTAEAITQSSNSAGLSGLAGGLTGFILTILYVRARRAGPKAAPVSKISPAMTGDAEVIGETTATTGPLQETGGVAEWFYARDGKRVGPVSEAEIHRMVAEGALPRTALIWRQGAADWVKIQDSELAEKASPSVPPPLSPTGIANGYIWALALAPIWGEILHYIAIYLYLRFNNEPQFIWDIRAEQLMWKTWQIPFLLNWGLALADEYALKAAGWKSSTLNKWMALLVPIYIYKRDQLVGANMARFWVWIGAMVVSVIVL